MSDPLLVWLIGTWLDHKPSCHVNGVTTYAPDFKTASVSYGPCTCGLDAMKDAMRAHAHE